VMALASVLAACGSSGSSSSPPVGTYAGTVSGSDAFVVVVAGKANVVVYVCDGAHGIAELFTGRRSAEGTLAFQDARGARVSVRIARRSASAARPILRPAPARVASRPRRPRRA
jgi:major membrane immunogen (membrane-anchored lipoprotein)